VKTMTAKKAARKRRKVEARMIEMCVSRYKLTRGCCSFIKGVDTESRIGGAQRFIHKEL
jgi:hypothetical protein